jgi:large subunit ribosomal protein L4
MELKITTLDGKEAGSITLSDEIYGLEPRADILQRCVRWQLSRRQAGTHDVKNRSEIWRTGKKMYRQKGTGGARHSSMRANLFRGGGRSFGPTPRSHALDLPKKVRALALRHALSSKAKGGGIVVLESIALDGPKTKSLKERFGKLGFANALIIDGAEVNDNFARAARNIPNVDVLPAVGINVYDIMRREKLILTRAAIEAIEARFNGTEKTGGLRETATAAAKSVASAARKARGAAADAASAVGSTVAGTAASARSAAAGAASTVSGAAAGRRRRRLEGRRCSRIARLESR